MDRDKYFDMGMQFMGHGVLDKAIKYFEKCLDLYETKEHKALCLNALGNALEKDEQTKKAEETYKKAIEMDPGQKLFYNNLFNLHKFQRKNKEAIEIFTKHLYNPQDPNQKIMLAELYTNVAKYEEAYDAYLNLIKQFPQEVSFYWKIALSCNSMGRNDEAVMWVNKGKQIDPENHHCNIALGIAQLFNKQIIPAKKTFENLKVDLYSKKWYLAYLTFLKKDYTEAWKNYEVRNEGVWAVKPLREKPMWDGTSMPDKTILVAAEQGLGDNVMAARWLQLLKKHFKHVKYWCNPRIYDVMLHLKEKTEIIQSASDATNFDVWMPIMSIPQRLGLTNDDMLLDDPYLIVEPKKLEGSKKKIGICWAGSNNHQYNRYRTIFEKDYDLLRNLIKKNDKFEWYSLIKDEYEDDNEKLGITNPVKDFKNVYETAQFIKGLDLVISIDTLQAHLAGAMKVPTILMLPWFPEWRWGLEGDTTVWYPSVEIIRQNKAFDWKSVIDRVDERLQKL